MKLVNSILETIEKQKDWNLSFLPEKYQDQEILSNIIGAVHYMKVLIENGEAGSRNTVYNPDGEDHFFVNKSTFPDFLQEIFFDQGTKAKFMQALERGTGKPFERIVLYAISILENGYQDDMNILEPDQDFINLVKQKESDGMDKGKLPDQ